MPELVAACQAKLDEANLGEHLRFS